MKNLLLSALLLVFFALNSFAQISNGGFESWSETNPDGWVGAKTQTSYLIISKINTEVNSGVNACGIQNTNSAHARFTTTALSVTNANPCTISFWVKGTGQVRTGLTDGGSVYLAYSAYYTASTSWTQTTATLIPTFTSNIAEFIIDLGISANLVIDDVEITGLSTTPQANITGFSFAEQTTSALINQSTQTVEIQVLNGTNLTALIPTISVSDGATISPVSGVAQDFTNPVIYTVTASDFSTLNWTVSVTEAPLSNTVSIYDIQYTTNVSGNSIYYGQSITTTGTVTAVVSGQGYYIQEAESAWSGIYVYTTANTPSVGDNLTITGTVSEYNNLTEITLLTNIDTNSTGNIINPIPTDFITANTEAYESVLVSISNAQCTALADAYGVWSVNDGTAVGKVDDIIYYEDPIVGLSYNITGIMYQRLLEFRILPRTILDVIVVTQNTQAEITAFTLTEQTGSATIDAINGIISIEVAFGTNLTALIPTIELSYGATIIPNSGIAQDFTNSVVYTVTAEDGIVQKLWTVTVSVASSVPNLSIYDVQYSDVSPFDSPYKGQVVTVTGTVVAKEGVKAYYIQDAAGAWNGIYIYDDINQPTIGDNVTVTGTVAEYYNLTQISSITYFNPNSSGNAIYKTKISTIDVATEQYESVYVNVENANCTALPVTYGIWSVNDGSGIAKVDDILYAYSRTVGVVYNITGVIMYNFSEFKLLPRSSSDVEVVTVLSSEKEILTFSFPQQTGAATISSFDAEVRIEVAEGTSLTSLIPTITVSNFATINPNSDVAQDFTYPVEYVVTAQDGSTLYWTVYVSVLQTIGTEANIINFSFEEQTSGATINTSTNTVDITVFAGTDVTALIPSISVSDGATINPLSGIARDFSTPVVYTVTAENGTKKFWIINVTVSTVLSSLADIKTFEIPDENYVISKSINTSTVAIEITVLSSLNLTSIIPTITVSEGASISPASGVAKNFTYPVVYTVTAADGSKKYWIVSFSKNTNKSISEIQYTTNISGDSPLVGQNVSVLGTVTAVIPSVGFYIQDAEDAWSGILVISTENTPNSGDKVEIYASVSENNNKTELNYVNGILVSIGNIVNPVSLENISIALSEEYESVLVAFSSVECVEILYSSGNWIASSSVDSILVSSELFLSTPQLNSHYDVTGIIIPSVYQYTILPRSTADVIHTLSVENEYEKKIQFYPNPVKNKLYISASNKIKEIEIISLLGQSIIKNAINNTNTSIQFENFAKGVYFVNCVLENNQIIKYKIIKE